jgi:hypothetical protein
LWQLVKGEGLTGLGQLRALSAGRVCSLLSSKYSGDSRENFPDMVLRPYSKSQIVLIGLCLEQILMKAVKKKIKLSINVEANRVSNVRVIGEKALELLERDPLKLKQHFDLLRGEFFQKIQGSNSFLNLTKGVVFRELVKELKGSPARGTFGNTRKDALAFSKKVLYKLNFEFKGPLGVKVSKADNSLVIEPGAATKLARQYLQASAHKGLSSRRLGWFLGTSNKLFSISNKKQVSQKTTQLLVSEPFAGRVVKTPGALAAWYNFRAKGLIRKA